MEKHFISYSCILISYIQCFEVSFQKSGYFSKKLFFLEFRLIHSDFRSIKILLKNFNKPLPGSIDRTCFSINWTSWIKFFLNTVFDSFKTLFQIFLKLSSLSPTWQGSTEDFLSFSTKFLQGFSLTRLVRPLFLFFCFYFHDFMHKLMHFNGIFGTFQIWGFCWINPLFLELIIGFCSYIVIFMIYVG